MIPRTVKKYWKDGNLKAIILHLPDNETRAIEVPQEGRPWKQIESIMESLDWEKAEAFSPEGTLLYVWEPEEEGEEEPREIEEPQLSEREERLLRLMLEAQDHALQAQMEATRHLTQGYATLAQLLVKRVADLERQVHTLVTREIRRAQEIPEQIADLIQSSPDMGNRDDMIALLLGGLELLKEFIGPQGQNHASQTHRHNTDTRGDNRSPMGQAPTGDHGVGDDNPGHD